MTVIVVEGPDGAGKSTLIDNLRLQSDRHYVSMRRSGPPKSLEEITSIVAWIEKHTGPTPLILDRHPFISESIYGKILRGKSLLENHYVEYDFKQHFRNCISRVIYCRPPTSVIIQKMQDNPQLSGVTKNIDVITQHYDWVMKAVAHWGSPVLRYDWAEEFNEGNPPLDHMFFGEVK